MVVPPMGRVQPQVYLMVWKKKYIKTFSPIIRQTTSHRVWFAKSEDGKERTIVFTLFIAVVVIMQIVPMVIVH